MWQMTGCIIYYRVRHVTAVSSHSATRTNFCLTGLVRPLLGTGLFWCFPLSGACYCSLILRCHAQSAGFFLPLGRRLLFRRQSFCLDLRPIGTALHLLPLGIPLSARALNAGPSRRYPGAVSPMPVFRLPHSRNPSPLRRLTRLCTELRNGQEELAVSAPPLSRGRSASC